MLILDLTEVILIDKVCQCCLLANVTQVKKSDKVNKSKLSLLLIKLVIVDRQCLLI